MLQQLNSIIYNDDFMEALKCFNCILYLQARTPFDNTFIASQTV